LALVCANASGARPEDSSGLGHGGRWGGPAVRPYLPGGEIGHSAALTFAGGGRARFHEGGATSVDGFRFCGGLGAELGEGSGVGGILSEVVVLGGISVEVEQHLELGSATAEIVVRFLEVDYAVIHADIFPAVGADAFLERSVAKREEAFEEEGVAPHG